MNGDGCGAWCGWCGRCSAGEGPRDFIESCSHPGHWADTRGGCRLCGASADTIERQHQQRTGIRAPHPDKKSA